MDKPTFKDLLERHDIPFLAFFESCLNVGIEDIAALYYSDSSTVPSLEKMIAHLNEMAAQKYTSEDVYLATLYGRTD